MLLLTEIEIFPNREMSEGTASDLLNEWEKIQEIIENRVETKLAKKNFKYSIKSLERWKIN